ncbi:MAG: hypothetical protein ABSH47_17940 [Bryobacteraceae bacterium]|jgi:hypothetical protein
MKLSILILLLVPLAAQEPAALAIRNVRYDAKKKTVDFDVANQSAKPVHAWLVTVALGNGTSLVTPRNCSPAGHCKADVDFGPGNASRLEPEVRVSAVLFEDGTAEGDLRLLQSEIDDARIRLRALESWQKDFDKTPSGIAYTSAVMNEREIVELLASKLAPAQRGAMLEQRVRAAQERARLFPSRDTPYAPPEAVASTRPITNRTPRFAIVSEEERTGQLRLVLRNGYDKEIVAFAFTQRQADGRIMRSSAGHAIAPGGLQEFQYGAVAEGDPLELACVIFRDGSADGDPAVVQKIRDGWAGRKAEKARILPLVRAVASLPAPERVAATRTLIADLQAYPQEQADAEHSIDFVLGEQAERKSVLRELRDLPLEESLRELQESTP